MKKNHLFENGKLFSLLCAAAALIFFIFACTAKGAVAVFLHILWVLSLGAGIYLLYAASKAKNARVNYFLYDRRRKKRVAPEALTFELVNDNLTHYLSPYIKAPADLWYGIPKRLHIQTQAEELFLPMIAYRMLYELSLSDEAQILKRFHGAKETLVNWLCRILTAAGDADMAELIEKMKRNPETKDAHVVAFFQKNRTVFEGRMVRFVTTHPNGFMTDKNSI